jgi:RsiW-degrading membrane proteinase PrsW (M82 family)
LWLLFYLRKDTKPEPKKMILKIFLYGALATLPAILLETMFFEVVRKIGLPSLIAFCLNIFLGVALIEEFLKFFVIKEKVLNNPEFDEPIDSMIYMIIAALGFAAAENLLILFPLQNPLWGEVIEISFLRFLGATFLHALCAAIVGYFIGLSFFEKEKRNKLIFVGLILAMLLHGFYNFSIIKIEKGFNLLISFTLLIIAAVFVSSSFKKLKRLAGAKTNSRT